MRWSWLLVWLLACGHETSLVEPAAQDVLWRINKGLDSVRVALNDLYRQGGYVSAVWVTASDSTYVIMFGQSEPPPVFILTTNHR